ncbi:unnamed protein product [Hermetia illucens]|uniref:Tetratricopeptide repeat protein 1 n=1 Tax=Hermetia illucens TaxID=343691 RepID=A0A7R8V5U3_HERIL|nr:tetratricopeptide repeat protein 1 [Hermetia illucens]CAD7093308.1 unnamed protein product [Hermetia illucens]
MSLKSDGRDNVSGDEEEFRDACSRTNEEIVDELVNEQLKNLSVQSDDEKLKDLANGVRNDEPTTSRLNHSDEEEHEDFADCIDDIIDDEGLKEAERDLTDEQKKENKEKADKLKEQGNELFKDGDYIKASELYTTALMLCPVESYPNERAILYGNRAAAKMKLNSNKAAIEDCTKALLFNPNYMKALIRRAKLYEDTDKLDESLEDYKKIQKLDPSNQEAGQALIRLSEAINERNEKLKTEMLGKLKDLGNMILKPFGLSTNNFQMQQDPSTGSYSINFNQNPQ